jgi:hypothetical protein
VVYRIKTKKPEKVMEQKSRGVTSVLSIKFEFGYHPAKLREWQEALRECGYYYSPFHQGYFNPEFGLLTYLHEICRDFDNDPQKFHEWYQNIHRDPEFKEKLKKMGELVLWSLRGLL